MRTSTTLILALATAGLFGGIWLYESQRPNSRETALRKEYVLLFDRAEIDGITISGGKSKIELQRDGSRWRMVKPVKDRANLAAIDEVLKLAGDLRKESRFAEGELSKKDFKTFGLRKPGLRLKLSGRNAPPELLFGKETAVEGKVYVRLEDSREVSVVSEELRNAVARDADTFRDPLLADVEGPHVDRVALRIPAGEIVMQKDLNRWHLAQPLRARASEKQVVDLIGSVLATEIVGFAPEGNPAQYGLAEPRATVTLQATSRKEPVVLELGAKDEKSGHVFARLGARQAICLLPERVERLLTLQPNDFRERTLAHVNEDVVDRIALDAPGKPRIIFDRHGEEWTLREGESRTPEPTHSARVSAMMHTLLTAEVKTFVADVAADLEQYDLKEPSLRVTLSSYSSENTAEALAGEEPIVTIAFGRTEGDLVYARAENEPYVVAVDKALLEELPASAAPWRALRVFPGLKPESVVSLEREGVRLERREGGAWELKEGEGVLNTVNLESLLNTLTRLDAMERFAALPEGNPVEGLERLRFTTAEGRAYSLMLYPELPEEGCYGALEGESGVFRLSAPDESALRLPLL